MFLVNEDNAVTSTVATVMAIDYDTELRGTVDIAIIAGNEEGRFYINSIRLNSAQWAGYLIVAKVYKYSYINVSIMMIRNLLLANLC